MNKTHFWISAVKNIEIMAAAAKILGYLGLKPANNLGEEEENTILTVSIERSTHSPLGGADAVQQIEVRQWLSFAKKSRDTFSRSDISSWDNALKGLDDTLRSKSYMVGTNITVADAAIYHFFGESIDVINLSNYLNVQRWFDHVQHVFRRNDKTIRLITIPKKVSLLSYVNTSDDSKRIVSPTIISSAPCTADVIQKTSSVVSAPTASSNEPVKKKEKQKTDKPAPELTQATAAIPAAIPAAATEKSVADPSLETSKHDPSKLDIRCGKVVKCWNHPESDKLLCEEIDVNDGPGVLRTIASGIRSAYSAEQLEGRMVLVLCNLKERAIAGFKSQVTAS